MYQCIVLKIYFGIFFGSSRPSTLPSSSQQFTLFKHRHRCNTTTTITIIILPKNNDQAIKLRMGKMQKNAQTKGTGGVVVVLLLILLSSSSVGTILAQETTTDGGSLKPRCGDCWCIFDEENLEVCPEDQDGITDTFPAQDFQIYQTFNLTNPDAPYLSLQDADGGECWPFADTLDAIEGYPKSSLPQCVLPEAAMSEEAVCAFLFEPGSECQSRNYQVLTYESTSAAEAAGAVVTHMGACGVCSDAYNLWARMASIDDFETDTLICGVSYLLNQDRATRFDRLVRCAQDAGLGPQCALLWAHYGATLVSACASDCNAGTVADTNGPPPQCALSPCPACPQRWSQNFLTLGGRRLEGSGMSDGTAKACSRFTRVEHDPCVGATTEAELPPTTAPQNDGATALMKSGFPTEILAAAMLLVGSNLNF